MRTPRDMAIDPDRLSGAAIGKNRSIDEIEMRKLLKRYNKTLNSSTGSVPKDMTEDDEIRYIAQKIVQQKAITQEEGYELGLVNWSEWLFLRRPFPKQGRNCPLFTLESLERKD